MQKFELSCAVTVSGYTVVEAETLEEAIKVAGDRDCVIGGINNGNNHNYDWVVDDIDGTPFEIHEA